jgi:hypothetical protein
MRRFLLAAFAIAALTLAFGVPTSAAPAGRPSHAVLSHAQAAQAAPTATVTTSSTVAPTPTVITQTKHDRRGLLGLFGLLGLLGLLKRPRKEVQTVIERPTRPVVDPLMERPRQ